MRTRPIVLDANGRAEKCANSGVGFRLMPAAPTDAKSTTRLGSFPVTVRLRGPGSGSYIGDPLTIVASDVRYCEDGEEFGNLDIVDGEAFDGWLVETFETRGGGVIPSGNKTRRTATVQTATALSNAAPVGAVGFRVRPGTLGHNFYFSGTLAAARIWARSKAGTWTDTLEDIDATTEPVAYRATFVSADRLYLQAPATMSLEVDVVEEVG